MNISEINGRDIKKALGCRKASFRYHNKHTRGGNFGFEVRDVEGFHDTYDFEISGDYDIMGEIRGLCINELSGKYTRVYCATFADVIAYINRYVETLEDRINGGAA